MIASNLIGRLLVLATVLAFAVRVAKADPFIYQHVLRSTAWVYNTQEQVTGSGVLVDLDNRLVMTNHHVVGSATEVQMYFTAYDERGELVTDPQVYVKNREMLEGTGIAMRGRVVARWKEKDLALVQLTCLPIEVQALALAADPVDSGENVHSIGNSGIRHGCLWRYTRGVVRNVYCAPNDECFVLECDSPVNAGDSGGPMVNDDAELVGIVTRHFPNERLVSQAIELREMRAFLEWYSQRVQRLAAHTGPADLRHR